MPPPRRPRDRLARALRVTADRLSAPGSSDAPGSPGSPEDVSRPPGQPPEHWRRLVAAHAPGLLRDLPPPPSPVEPGLLTDPTASGSPDQTRTRRDEPGRRGMGRLWRGWKALLADRFGTPRSRTRRPHGADPGSSSRSWYETAPTGATSYQDLQGVPFGGTGVPGAGSREPAEVDGGPPGSAGPGAAASRAGAGSTRAASTWNGPRSGSARPGSGPARAGSEPVGEGSGSAGAGNEPAGAGRGTGRARARSGSAEAGSSAPAAGAAFSRYDAGPDTVAASGLPPASRYVTGPDRPTTAGDADATGSTGTPGGAPTPGAARRSDTAGSTGGAGSARTARTTGGTETAGSRATGTAGSPGTPTSGGPDRQSPATGRPGLGADRAGALTRRARADRSRERRRADDPGTEPSPARDDVLPLLFAAASPHGWQGRAGHDPGRAVGSPYPNGRHPAPGGDFRARPGQRPARHTPGSPWPALPDDAGPAPATNPTGAARATDGSSHADPWPALPGEPAWWTPATRATPWSDTARLDREQAGD